MSGENKTMGVRIRQQYSGDKEVAMFLKQTVTEEGKMVFALLEKWGMVAAMDDGEDSTGRHKVRLASVEEVVGRAFAVTRLFMLKAEEFGYIMKLPDLNEINAPTPETEKV
jgi:hypothetical protein